MSTHCIEAEAVIPRLEGAVADGNGIVFDIVGDGQVPVDFHIQRGVVERPVAAIELSPV